MNDIQNQEMKYPVLAFKNDKLLYGFRTEKDLRRTSRELLASGVFKSVFLIDSNGDKFTILNVKEVGWANDFWGYSLLKKGRQILVDFELQFEKELLVNEFKNFVLMRLEKENYADHELRNNIMHGPSYKAIIDLFC